MTAPTPSPAQSLAAVAESGADLLRTVERMSPGQVFEPSALPGWTRGHVLAHLARNADALGNLLLGARTSQSIPMYSSPEARERGIQDGAKRSLAEHLADLRAAGLRFAAVAEAMPPEAWNTEVVHRNGGTFPAWNVPVKRVAEIEYHHVDLGLDYTPAHWPADFVARELALLTERYRDADGLAPVRLHDTDTGVVYELGRGAGPRPEPSAPSRGLLAWLSGRSDGSALGVPVAELPQLPPMG